MLLKHKEREEIIRVKHNIVESPATQDGWLRGGGDGANLRFKYASKRLPVTPSIVSSIGRI
jgi:hypothetical protein